MKDMSMNLREVMEYMRNHSVEDSMNKKELWDFVNSIDAAGTSALKDLDGEYILGMLALIKAVCVERVLSEPNFNNAKLKLITSMFDPEFDTFIAMIMKISIGISVMEEIR